MAQFNTVHGDIFDSPAQVLVNPVNCHGAMGAGLAKQFWNRYPEIDPPYRVACRARTLRPGTVLLLSARDGRTIANLPTKDHWRNPSHLDDVRQGLRALNRALAQGGFTSVAVPALGTGLGGLDWRDVEPALRQELDIDGLTMELYPPRKG